MNTTHSLKRRTVAALATAAAVAGGALALSAPATAGPSEKANERAHEATQCAGRSVPASKISFQLYSYFGWQREIGIDALLDELQEIGIKNVEPFGASYEGYSHAEFRDVLKEHGMKAPSSHGSTNEASFATTLANAKDLGQKYVGSGGFASPGIGSYENVLATAETMNRLGEQSVKNGTGKLFGHNHASEFTTQYEDPATGEMKSAWQILVENTDPRYVAFQLDVFWAVSGGVDPVQLLNAYGDRIELLHIKDGVAPYGFGDITDVGEGDIDWAPILDAAQGKVKLYVLERDGAPATAEFARDSFEFLTCYTY
ncbi:sugar phosphate isomerase/epimerase [Demequina sp. NBRC 110056]|uniref:sugar phosphate isomerase/epimerase family protein n=1 Tax=Demequina sp. NBRC 110056 TaxID=1570345 RepID=UPI000A04CC6F|nr:sugar phosphate isomerase/epimerase [Demequina sp. NBRC 110056]